MLPAKINLFIQFNLTAHRTYSTQNTTFAANNPLLMSASYSQTKALWAITRASFKAIFANPSGIVFSILFPIIFIMIFGAFGNGGPSRHKIAIAPGCDTTNALFDSLRHSDYIRIVRYPDSMAMKKDFAKGNLAGVLDIKKTRDTTGADKFLININTTSASGQSFGLFMQSFKMLILQMELGMNNSRADHFIVIPHVEEVQQYKPIDFILPGQLGFSILFSTLFGIAFTFFNLREQLVLKRFYASPVSRINILLGIGMSRLFFQLINVVILILFGHFMLNFTLQHGFTTLLEMIIMSVYMLFLLLGVGLIFSSIVKSDTVIPLLINLFGFPQMLLSGTFFSIDVFPKWLQQICNILPLTNFNNAMRKISFEGLSLVDCWKEIGILAIWMGITYIILVRVLKWE
jgi:ABC-2 type transport system permease protein